jgi:hypothetical protein
VRYSLPTKFFVLLIYYICMKAEYILYPVYTVVPDREAGTVGTPYPAMLKRVCAVGKEYMTPLEPVPPDSPPGRSSAEVQQPWEKPCKTDTLHSGHATAGSRHRQSENAYIIDHCDVAVCDNIFSPLYLSLLNVPDTHQLSHICT